MLLYRNGFYMQNSHVYLLFEKADNVISISNSTNDIYKETCKNKESALELKQVS